MALVISMENVNKDIKNDSDEEKIIAAINQLSPYLNSDGGDIEYIKYEDGFVFVKLYGACAACAFQDYTLQDNIFESLKEIVPSVKGVINVEL